MSSVLVANSQQLSDGPARGFIDDETLPHEERVKFERWTVSVDIRQASSIQEMTHRALVDDVEQILQVPGRMSS